MLDIDIDSLIPHRKKIKIINHVIDIQENSAVSAAMVLIRTGPVPMEKPLMRWC